MSLEGIQLGNYRLMRMIGSGGMGEIYLAEDVRISRQVAIKVVRAEAAPYPDEQEVKNASRLFQREMHAITMLDHPHILPLYDFGEQNFNNTPITYMVMPYRREGSLNDWLQRRVTAAAALAPQDAATLIQQAADALQHAHSRQLVHQDVKPSNFLIQSDTSNPDRPYLLLADFGVSKLTSATATSSQNVRGTPAYMPPEQWEGHPVPATDQYALAVLTYQLLTGRVPFVGRMEQVMHQHFMVQPQPPSAFNLRIPPTIDAVILRALAKNPGERFPSVSTFARAFQEAVQSIHSPYLASSAIVPETITPSERTLSMGSSDVDILATLAISQVEALTGTSRTLTLPGGRHVTVNILPGAYDGQIIRLEGQGAPATSGQMGALILTLSVQQVEERRSPDPDDMNKTVRASSDPNLPPTVADSPPPIIPVPPPLSQGTPVPRSSLSKGKLILSAVVALIIIASSVGGFFVIRSNQAAASASATATTAAFNANTTVMAQNATATANAVAFQATATAQAQAFATATASTIAANPYPSYLLGRGTLALYDPLHNNSYGYVWDENNNCSFSGGTYHVTNPVPQYLYRCAANSTNFSNFAYELALKIIKGDEGGMIFRADNTNSQFYLFDIDRNGYYGIFLYRNFNPTVSTLVAKTFTTAINQGLNQTNVIAVVAQGSTLTIYVNQQQLASINDSAYNTGSIGVSATSFANANDPTDVAFSNAKVWTF